MPRAVPSSGPAARHGPGAGVGMGLSPRSARFRPKAKLQAGGVRRRSGGVGAGLVASAGAGASAPGATNILVGVRVRPENEKEVQQGHRTVIQVVDSRMLIFDPADTGDDGFFYQGKRQTARRDVNKRANRDHKFAFDVVFGPDADNETVFQGTTLGLLDTLFSGYNCSVFVYGATGAGKTHTMLGKEGNPGLTFRTVMELYRRMEAAGEEQVCEVGVSYVEVYNETIVDLINPGQPLAVREDGNGVNIPGLSVHKPENAEGLLKFLQYGNANRTQHPTDANAESSRSHAVFQVYLKQKGKAAGLSASVRCAKLSMIDLAGSERAAAVSQSRGAVRLREGANINKSLLALGNCINALAEGSKYIPYRNSKLTRLLKDSIGGNCKTVMISNVSPSSMTFEDTYNTLKYADRAKRIKVKLKRNVTNVDFHVGQYAKIVESLQQDVESWKARTEKAEKEAKEAKEELSAAQARISDLEAAAQEAAAAAAAASAATFSPSSPAEEEEEEEASKAEQDPASVLDKTFELDRTYDMSASSSSSRPDEDEEQSTMQMSAETVVENAADDRIRRLQEEVEQLRDQLEREREERRKEKESAEQQQKEPSRPVDPAQAASPPPPRPPAEAPEKLKQLVERQKQLITTAEAAKHATKLLQLQRKFADNKHSRARLLLPTAAASPAKGRVSSGRNALIIIRHLLERLRRKYSKACIRERKLKIRRDEGMAALREALDAMAPSDEWRQAVLNDLKLLESFSLVYKEQDVTESVIAGALPIVRDISQRLGRIDGMTNEEKKAVKALNGIVCCENIQFRQNLLVETNQDTAADRMGPDFAEACSKRGVSEDSVAEATFVLDDDDEEEKEGEDQEEPEEEQPSPPNLEKPPTSPLKRSSSNSSDPDDTQSLLTWNPPTPPKKLRTMVVPQGKENNDDLPPKKKEEVVVEPKSVGSAADHPKSPLAINNQS